MGAERLLSDSGLYIRSLSPEQNEAVKHVYGPCEVIAGPGSGKTSVIVNRLQYLIHVSGIDPSTILTITFTKAAALEMKTRAGKVLSDLAGAVTFGTFHSIFLNILRHTYRFTKDNIIDLHTGSEIIKELLESNRFGSNDAPGNITGLLNEISRIKCGSSEDKDRFRSAFLEPEQLESLFMQYKKRMNELRLIDFDDMLLLSRDLFKERPDVLKKWQEKYRFIMTDEFQDVDRVQYELLTLLSGETRNLFVVGDDDQSIYGFRGAHPGIMKSFSEDFKDTKLIFLTRNFRSAPEIVEAAGAVIKDNKDRLEKHIVAASRDKGLFEIREFKDREEEMEAFHEIVKTYEGHFNRAAILLRTNGAVSFYTEKASSLDIPFRCREKIKNVYDHFIARDILDYLSLASGNKLRSTLYRVMNRPFRGISRNSVSDSEYDEKEILSFHSGDIRTLSKIRKLFRDLYILSKMKPYSAVHYILKAMGYEDFLKDQAVSRKLDRESLLQTAEEIKERAKGYRSFAAWKADIDDYVREISIVNSREKGEKDPDREAVNIMTLHGSKGLEFDEVFLFDVNEKIIPCHRAVLPSEIEEERRLLYVGMTRAKKKLHIWYARENMGKTLKLSRFFDLTQSIGGRFCDCSQTEDKICQEEQGNMQ